VKIQFEIDKKIFDEFDDWFETQNQKAIEQQKVLHSGDRFFEECWEMGEPYSGAIGGILTYQLTRTSIGDIIKAIHNITKEEIDLTNYDGF
jgi:hypothetical protein